MENRRPPVTRSTLPSLTDIEFNGASEYLEDLVARIDAPRLDKLSINFIPPMNLDTPHLVQFISRTPRFKEPNEAHANLDFDAEVELLWACDDDRKLCVGISSDPQPSSIVQLYTMCLPPLPTVENLRLGLKPGAEPLLAWKDDVANDQWLELLRPFTAVKSLSLSEEFQPNMASALQELVGDRTTEVLPSLQEIVLEAEGIGPSRADLKAIGKFAAARQLSGHPIAVQVLDDGW
jgi:hypothetical protein